MLLAALIGLVAGYYIAKKFITNFNLVIVMYAYRGKEKFEDLYEFAENEVFYEFAHDIYKRPKTFYEFQLLHQAGREFAHEIFLEIIDAYLKYLIKIYSLILVISLIIFQRNTLYFLLGAAAVHAGMYLYTYYVKDHRLGFNLMFLHHMIISDKKVKKRLRLAKKQ